MPTMVTGNEEPATPEDEAAREDLIGNDEDEEEEEENEHFDAPPGSDLNDPADDVS